MKITCIMIYNEDDKKGDFKKHSEAEADSEKE